MAKNVMNIRSVKKLSPEGQATVREIVKEVIDNDPNLKHWVSMCRATVGRESCDRDVFGNCDRCDRQY